MTIFSPLFFLASLKNMFAALCDEMAYDGSLEADPEPVSNANPQAGLPPSSPSPGSQQAGDPSNSFLDSLKDIFASIDEDITDDTSLRADPSELPPSGSPSRLPTPGPPPGSQQAGDPSNSFLD